MESLSQIFYEEASEMLELMEQILLSMEEGGATPEVVNDLFRYAHSLKGNSAAMGFSQISRFTHGLENALDSLRKGSLGLSREMADLLLSGVDVSRRLVEASKEDGDVGDPACADILRGLQEIIAAGPVATAAPITTGSVAGTPRYRVRYVPGPLLDADNDPIRCLLELTEHATILGCRLDGPIPPLDLLDPFAPAAGWDLLVETNNDPVIIRVLLELSADGTHVQVDPAEPSAAASEAVSVGPVEVVADPGDEDDVSSVAVQPEPLAPDAAAAPAVQRGASQKKSSEAQTIRVSTDKVDALFNLTSEIVIAQSMLSNAQARIMDAEASSAIAQMERYVRELHERVMAIRMIPVGYVFNRFPRMVRDLAAASGKEIHLAISGEETELDRTLLEALTDPLTHLLRNSIDHGIESPEGRAAAGKSAAGTVRLNAYQAEGRIYIEVADDGKGIDLERVRRKAIDLDWIREEDRPAPDALYEMLFRPGFSTAEKVSDVSGRGVGMDVVKRNVEGLGGVVATVSEPGKGTRFTIRVPLTLAIMEGLNLRVGPEHFIVPLTSVLEAFRPDSVNVCTACGANEMVNIRGKFVPLLRMSHALGISSDGARNGQDLIVLLEQDEQQLAIAVDEIVGQHQVVMKSLEANFERVEGFSGATILGDGRVALIVDVGSLLRSIHRGVAQGAYETAA